MLRLLPCLSKKIVILSACVLALFNFSQSTYGQSGSWYTYPFGGDNPIQRHESAFVQSGDKFYLIGGRGNTRRNMEFDINTGLWKNRAKLPKDPVTNITLELHHMQLVSLDGLIYVVGAFTGGFPNEIPLGAIIIYDPLADTWIQGPDIPLARRRGSAGAVVYDGKIYLLCGITNGHINGWVNWVDVFDPATNTWTQLADAPRARDHFHAEVYDGKIYLAGGRRTGSEASVFGGMVSEVDVYDIASNTWSTLPSSTGNIPTPRAGTSTALINHPTAGDLLVVVGGESDLQTGAHVEVDALHLASNQWLPSSSLASWPVGRHGTQLITSNNGLYVAAGASPDRGGGSEIMPSDPEFLLSYYPDTPTSPTGTATTKGDIDPAIGSAAIEFGIISVGSSGNETARIENNNGNQALVINDIALSGADSAEFAVNLGSTLPVIIPPGSFMDIPLVFTPTTSDPDTSHLVVSHSGNSGSTVITLTGGNGSPAPVELLGFRGRNVDNQVLLSWETGQEVNSDFFDVERSADGLIFSPISRVAAQGNSQEVVAYETLDKTPLSGRNFYRLKQVDLDGSFEYSNTIELTVDGAHFSVFPNPVSPHTNLEIQGVYPDGEVLTFRMMDLMGKEVLRESLLPVETQFNQQVTVPRIPQGVYLLTIATPLGDILYKKTFWVE